MRCWSYIGSNIGLQEIRFFAEERSDMAKRGYFALGEGFVVRIDEDTPQNLHSVIEGFKVTYGNRLSAIGFEGANKHDSVCLRPYRITLHKQV